MRELQHVADPYRQHFYPSHSSYDPHFDPMFRPHDKNSSSALSMSVQDPTVLSEPVPPLDPVVEEVFSATSSSDSSNLYSSPTLCRPRLLANLLLTLRQPSRESIPPRSLDSLDSTVSSLPLTEEESSPPVNAAVPTTAIPTAKSIVYNNRRRSKKAKTIFFPLSINRSTYLRSNPRQIITWC